MSMSIRLMVVFFRLVALLAFGPPAVALAAPAKAPTKAAKASARPAHNVAPLAAGEEAAWSHAPFETGDCSICHQKNDPRAPGPLRKVGNDLCYSCHEEVQAIMERKFKHPP